MHITEFTFKKPRYKSHKVKRLVAFINYLANKARRYGLLALEEDIYNINNILNNKNHREILTIGLTEVINGIEPDLIERILSIILKRENNPNKTDVLSMVIAESILSIQAGDNPRIIILKINSYLGTNWTSEELESYWRKENE